jgi:hypothetical protein
MEKLNGEDSDKAKAKRRFKDRNPLGFSLNQLYHRHHSQASVVWTIP